MLPNPWVTSESNNLIASVNLLKTLPIKTLILDDIEAHRLNRRSIARAVSARLKLRPLEHPAKQ